MAAKARASAKAKARKMAMARDLEGSSGASPQGAQQIATTGSNLCMAMAIEWDNHGIHSGE